MNKITEEDYVDEKIAKFNDNFRLMHGSFVHAHRKDIENVIKDAKLEYRSYEISRLKSEIKEERHRIDELVKQINFRFNEFLRKNQMVIDNEKKAFDMKVKPYEQPQIPTLFETVIIRFEPMAVTFIQEMISDD